MSLKKLNALVIGFAVASSLLVASPVNAANTSENQPSRPFWCQATFQSNKTKGLLSWGYDKTFVTNGKKIKLFFKIDKGCGGKIQALIGKKVVKTVKVKKNKATLTIPASKFKAVKSYKLSLKYGKEKLKYTVWKTKGTLTPNARKYVVYMDNEVPWSANVTWAGPVDPSVYSRTLYWYRGKLSQESLVISENAEKAAGTTKSVFKGTVSGLFRPGEGAKILNAPGTYALNLGFYSTSLNGFPKAALETTATVEVRSNHLALAPGVYTWANGKYGCTVKVFGTDRGYGDYEFFYDEAAARGIQINPTDTAVEFSDCSGGPVKIR